MKKEEAIKVIINNIENEIKSADQKCCYQYSRSCQCRQGI